MNKIRSIIIDDETNSRHTLRSLLALCAPEVIVEGEAKNAAEARIQIDQKKPDLVFLDIQMPGEDGFELLRSVNNPAFKVIFTTAYQQYAAKAFRYSAVDYLLKPIDPDELIAAIKKITADRQPINPSQVEILQEHFEHFKKTDHKPFQKKPSGDMKLALAIQDGVYFVQLKDIIWCEGIGAYTKFHIVNQPPILISKVLKEYEEILEDFYFFRTHKSSLINLEHVKKFVRGEGGQVWMSNGSEIEVSRRRKEELVDLLSKIFLSGSK
jgi:two-component system LytT family response regulator